jgi:hypothetical protein
MKTLFLQKNKLLFIALTLVVISVSCKDEIVRPTGPYIPPTNNNNNTQDDLVEGVDYFLPNINLNNWKVTLPIGNPTEVPPPAILDYATNDLLKPFMYNDSTDGSLVFYTYPGSTTTNTSYSRTELREQMISGNNSTNWTFAQGGRMKGTLKLDDISTDASNKTHRTIIMQIHGRLSNTQKAAIGASDNNAPPIVKVYWAFNRVRVLTKVLKDTTATGNDILPTDAWDDRGGVYFSEYVNNDPFTLEIIASDGRLEIILNDNESMVFDDIHIQKWGAFENYFKAGNYLASIDAGSFAKVKYYDLEVTH